MVAGTSRFSRGLGRAGKTVRGFGAGIGRVAKRAARFGAVLGGVVAAGLLLIIRRSLKAIDTLAKFSAAIGVSVNQLQAMQLGANIAGIETDKLDKALKRMIKSVSDGVNGLSTAVRAFDALGLKADELARLDPAEIFKQIADAVMEAGGNVKTLGAIMDIFGARNGAELIQLLKLGREGIEAMEREIHDLGLALSGIDVAQVEAANDAMTRMKGIVRGIANRITVELAPFLEAAVNKFVEMGSEGTTAGDSIVIAMEKSTKAIAVVVEGVEALAVAWQSLNVAMSAVVAVTAKAIAALAKFAQFTNPLVALFGRDLVQSLDDFAEGAKAAYQIELALLDKKFTELGNNSWGDDILKTFDEIREAARLAAELAAAANDEFNELAAQADEAAEAFEKMQREAERIIEQTLTPFERRAQDLERLKEIFDAGLLSAEQYQRAIERIEDAFKAATKTAEELVDTQPDEPAKRGEFGSGSVSRVALQGVRSQAQNAVERRLSEMQRRFEKAMKDILEQQKQPHILQWSAN